MALKDILVIAGQSGLFKYISKGRNNVIAEGLSDSKRIAVPATAKMSKLEDITVFTTNDENVYLREVLKNIQIKENGGAAIPHKSPDAELKKYFAEVLPEYDKDRVYLSDIRKIVLWYNLLLEFGITDFEPEAEKEENSDDESNDDESKKDEPIDTENNIT